MKLDDRAVSVLSAWVARPEEGDVLDERFELRERIGEGGMGVVYAAWDRVGERVVAVKVVNGGGDHDAARFEREVRSLAGVTHPAIVGYVAHGLHGESRYLVMDRLEGASLAERLGEGRLSVEGTLVLGRRIADALAAVHRAAIVHRDLKPSNVFLPEGDPSRACLLDFGLARGVAATTLTADGALVGTPSYIAPERLRAEGPSVVPEGDVFSLGCVLYECLVGSPLFQGDTTYAVLARVLLEGPAEVGRERPDVPLGLERLVARMLAKEPVDRPAASEVAAALDALEPPPSKAAPDELAPGISAGDLVGSKYRVVGKLGEGGMGVVLSATHVELGTQVAIKVLRAGDDGRLLREAQATSRIGSEHVARVLDVGRADDGRPFIVMEQLRGEDMARRLAKQGPLPIDVAIEHLISVCATLSEAHALGIVHRDLKPSNLFLVAHKDGSERVKVLDFGISKLTRRRDDGGITDTATADATVMGSVVYSAPEQLQSSASVDARSDVWSLGVVLFELVTGTRPFSGENALAVAMSVAASDPKPLRTLLPAAPAALERVLTRCLAKAPSARFQDVDALALALRAVRSHRTARIRRTLLVTLAIPVLGAAVAVGFGWKTPATPAAAEPAVPALPETAAPSVGAPERHPAATSSDSAPAPILASSAPVGRAPIPRQPAPTASSARSVAAVPVSGEPSSKKLNVRDPALDER